MWTSSDDSSICITLCSDCDRTSTQCSVLDLQELTVLEGKNLQFDTHNEKMQVHV